MGEENKPMNTLPPEGIKPTDAITPKPDKNITACAGKRRCEVYEWNIKTSPRKKILVGTGTFHLWATDYVEFETGPGHFPAAVVEMDDGTVRSVHVEGILFIDRSRAMATYKIAKAGEEKDDDD